MICKEELKICRVTPQNKYDRCKNRCQKRSDSKIKCQERESSYILENNDRIPVIVFRVDGGVVCNEESCKKCDYIYYISNTKASTVIFIELKGSDYEEALKQIENSVKLFKEAFFGSKFYARIVCTRFPNINNNPTSRKIKTFLKEQKINLDNGKFTMKESIKDLLK